MYDYDVKYAKKCKYLELIITFFPHYLNNIWVHREPASLDHAVRVFQ